MEGGLSSLFAALENAEPMWDSRPPGRLHLDHVLIMLRKSLTNPRGGAAIPLRLPVVTPHAPSKAPGLASLPGLNPAALNLRSLGRGALATYALALALAVVMALALSPGGALAQESEPQLPYDEDEALAIDRMLICPVCPAETIDQAQVEISRQMRAVVRQMLADGASREEILDFFVARYGPQILAAPPKSGVNLLAWLLPLVGVIAALGGGLLVIRAMASRGAGSAAAAPAWEEKLDPYLQAVDADLALPAGGESAQDRGEDGLIGNG